MLATGYIKLLSNTGEKHFLRALFDSGSEVNIITERAAIAIAAKIERTSIEVIGISGHKSYNNSMTETTIHPWFDSDEKNGITTQFIIMKVISSSKTFHFKKVNEFSKLQLANPEYNKSGALEVLLGLRFWADIVCGDLIISDTGLRAQLTTFGYVIFGSVDHCELFDINVNVLHAMIDEENLVIHVKLLINDFFKRNGNFIETQNFVKNLVRL